MLTILQHKIDFWLKDEDEKEIESLNEADEEHIENMIKEGYSEGQLCSYQQLDDNNEPTELWGWWKIVKS